MKLELKPESAEMKPEDAAMKRENAQMKPEDAEMKPENAEMKSNVTLEPKPENTDMKPEDVEMKPEIKPEEPSNPPAGLPTHNEIWESYNFSPEFLDQSGSQADPEADPLGASGNAPELGQLDQLGLFWECCKKLRKCAEAPFDQLLNNPVLRADYH